MTRWPFRFTAYALLLHQVWGHDPPINGIQAAQILYIALPLCWLLVGIASLVFRPLRVKVALT
jgi:hypothetical protein